MVRTCPRTFRGFAHIGVREICARSTARNSAFCCNRACNSLPCNAPSAWVAVSFFMAPKTPISVLTKLVTAPMMGVQAKVVTYGGHCAWSPPCQAGDIGITFWPLRVLEPKLGAGKTAGTMRCVIKICVDNRVGNPPPLSQPRD